MAGLVLLSCLLYGVFVSCVIVLSFFVRVCVCMVAFLCGVLVAVVFVCVLRSLPCFLVLFFWRVCLCSCFCFMHFCGVFASWSYCSAPFVGVCGIAFVVWFVLSWFCLLCCVRCLFYCTDWFVWVCVIAFWDWFVLVYVCVCCVHSMF